MTKFLAAILVAALGAATLPAAQAAQGCGHGWHRNHHGTCMRNRRVVYVPPPRVPVYEQTITTPARTGIIPGQANAAHSVCAYNYHPDRPGDCVPN